MPMLRRHEAKAQITLATRANCFLSWFQKPFDVTHITALYLRSLDSGYSSAR
jgi:hypothetical protein